MDTRMRYYRVFFVLVFIVDCILLNYFYFSSYKIT